MCQNGLDPEVYLLSVWQIFVENSATYMSQNTTNALQIPDSMTGIKSPQLVMLFFLEHASIGYVAPDNSNLLCCSL